MVCHGMEQLLVMVPTNMTLPFANLVKEKVPVRVVPNANRTEEFMEWLTEVPKKAPKQLVQRGSVKYLLVGSVTCGGRYAACRQSG